MIYLVLVLFSRHSIENHSNAIIDFEVIEVETKFEMQRLKGDTCIIDYLGRVASSSVK